VFNIAGQMPL